MDKELAQYIRGVAARRSASEMLEDDLFLSSLLTDLVFGVQPRMCDGEACDASGVQKRRARRDSATGLTAAN